MSEFTQLSVLFTEHIICSFFVSFAVSVAGIYIAEFFGIVLF